MPIKYQEDLPDEIKNKLLRFLNNYGKSGWLKIWKKHMALPDNLSLKDREKILRYILIRAIINQQAITSKVEELTVKLYEKFKIKLLKEPWNIDMEDYLKVFMEVGGPKGSKIYRVGVLGGIKPASLFVYRYVTYSSYIKYLEKAKVTIEDIVKRAKNVRQLYDKFRNDEILYVGWVGNDPKACRMLVNWITYLYTNIWKKIKTNLKMKDTLMIVDGHVGKIFARTGLLRRIKYEKRRPYIIQAAKMRLDIEKLVSSYPKLSPFYVDNGAYYLFRNGYCQEKNPKCAICPIDNYCLKYIKWTAYRQYKEEK